jgi:predicted TIM-barrel fold metal-dependent hydrolase
MNTHGFRVFDADGHVLESDDELVEHYEGDYKQSRRQKTWAIFPSLDGWARGVVIVREDGGRKYMHTDAKVWGEILDMLGLEGTVVYPTAALGFGLMTDVSFAVATATAYNNWLEERYCKLDARIHAAGLLPIQDPQAAAKEIERCAKHRTNFPVGLLTSRMAMSRSYGDAFFDPIYEAAEKFDLPLALHGAPSRGLGFDHFNEFVKVHALEHAVPQFIHITDMIFSGVFDRFPKLRVAFLEAGASWVPWMMDRLDYEYESIFGTGVRARLRKKPSQYFTEGENMWFSLELEERRGLKYTVDAIGSERLFYASDYPHEPKEGEMKHELEEFLEDETFSHEARQNIVYNNAMKFYRLKSLVKSGA